jgi:hypothetical protein
VSYASALRLFLPVFLNLEKLQSMYKDDLLVSLMPVRRGVAEAILKDLHYYRVAAPFKAKAELEVRGCTILICIHVGVLYIYTYMPVRRGVNVCPEGPSPQRLN